LDFSVIGLIFKILCFEIENSKQTILDNYNTKKV